MEADRRVRPNTMFSISTLLVLLTCELLVSQLGPARAAERIQLEYSISEELHADTLVANIGIDAKLAERYGADVFGTARFLFLKQNDPNKEYFSINEATSELHTRKTIDREAICAQTLDCWLQFDVAIRPVPKIHLEIVAVRIRIRDMNDNAPTFQKPRMSMSISESVMPGVSFVIPAARDPDSGRNGIQGYDFRSSSRKFELKAQNTSDGTWDLKLVLRERLDREARQSYTMRVIARDGGSPPRTGDLTIEVNVIDANDNAPKFDNATYDVSVREDSKVGSTIVKLHATDKDRGPNGRITYTLSQDTVDRFGSLFGINNSSGEIFLKGALDYEKDQIYHLIAIASDQGGLDSVSTHARVVVRILDVNDHRPRITVNALTSSGQVQIPENADPGSFVTHISVEDDDKGKNGEVTCTLRDRNFDIQHIYQNEYTIFTVAGMFDRERQASFRVTIECQDQGKPPLQSTKQIRVQLLDENDHAPVFAQDIYGMEVRENNSINVRLLTVNATDGDEGANARITYTLHPDARGLVKIDPNTGVITANTVLDYEKRHKLRFQVIAADNGSPPLSATATVVLDIVDINDESPVFSEPTYNFATYENQDIGTEIGTVIATDPDSSPYNRVTYTLRADMASRGTFQIHPESGRITTRRLLDREYQPTYTLVVLAGNRGFPFTTSSVTVTVYVADRNDNAPLIEFPNLINNTVQVSYMAPVGYVLTRVIATDADFSNNARLQYSVVQGNDDGLFAMDSMTGAITVNQNLENHGGKRYRLLLMVKDHGDHQKSAVTSINIVLNKTMSLISHRKAGSSGSHIEVPSNQTIVIIMGVASFVLVILLIVAIILVKRKQKKRNHRDSYKYMRRVDLEHQSPSPKHIPNMRRVETDDKVDTLTQSKSDNNADVIKTHLRFELDSDFDEKPPHIPSPTISRSHSNGITQKDGKTKPEQCPMTTFRYHDEPSHDLDMERENERERELYMERERREREREPPPPPAPEDPHTCPRATKVVGECRDGRDPRSYHSLPRHRLLYDPQHGLHTGTLTQKELEVHQLLHRMMQDPGQDSDSASACSADMSNTDSGRGPSEDGDNHSHPHHHGNTGTPNDGQPPPPPYESLWQENRRMVNTNDAQEQEPLKARCPEQGPGASGRRGPGPQYVKNMGQTDSGLHIRRFPTNCNQLRPPGTRYPIKNMSRLDHNGIKEQLTKIHNNMPNSQCGARPSPAGAPATTRTDCEGQQVNGHHGNNNDVSKPGRETGDGAYSRVQSAHESTPLPNQITSPAYKETEMSPTESDQPSSNVPCNTFGHAGPLRPLGKVDESRDEISDDSTTTSGSFELHGDADSPRVHIRTKMDTVV